VKSCPVDLHDCDSGWVLVPCRHQLEMLKLWHHLATMDDSQLTKEIFKWSLALANKGKSSWEFHVTKLHTDIDLGHLNPENVTCLSAKEFQTITIAKLTDKANHKSKVQMWNLNAYSSDSGGIIEYKPSPESYLCNIICKGHRWIMAAFRGGCLPLHVEVGRYRTPKTPYNLHSCNLCSSNSVETETIL